MIEEIGLLRLEIPLATPYKLALGSVRHLDTILVRLRAAGRTGIGEATILTGYTDETIDGSWTLARALAPRLAGLAPANAKRAALEAFDRAPFTVSAVVSALEMVEGHRLLRVDAPAGVPILAVVNAMESAGIAEEIERFIAAGYGTLKIKVGFDADADLARVRLIQRLNRGRARLRPIRASARPRAAASPQPSIRTASNCSSSPARPATGRPRRRSPASRPSR
jgi:L-alanine-DL-glutamate epimerase-like enolase superfamily enzyme